METITFTNHCDRTVTFTDVSNDSSFCVEWSEDYGQRCRHQLMSPKGSKKLFFDTFVNGVFTGGDSAVVNPSRFLTKPLTSFADLCAIAENFVNDF